MSHIHLSQQILEQIECRRVEPLQIVQEQGERMFRPCEYADESPEHQLEAALRVLHWKFRDGWLFSQDKLQFGNQVHDEASVRTERLTNGIPPPVQLCLALTQKRPDKTLKGLRQRGIWDVALVLVKLARREKATGRDKRFMELVDDG